MPNYPITVSVDPTQAGRGIDVVESRLDRVTRKASTVETAMQRAFDFDSGPATASVSAVDKALDGLQASSRSAAAAVTASSSMVEAATTRVKTAVDGATTSTRTLNTELGLLSAPSKRAADSMGEINANLVRLYGTTEQQVKANQRLVQSDGQVRAAKVQLGQQFNDFSTQVLAGGSVVTAFAQQAGQAAFAMSGMNGAVGAVGRFLAGPWGTILIIATTVLAGFVSKLFETSDAADKAEEGLRKFQQRQSNIGNFIDATTGKLIKQNAALIANAQLTREKSIAEGRAAIRDLSSQAFETARARQTTVAVGTGSGNVGVQSNITDPAVNAAIKASGNNVFELDRRLRDLAKTRPGLKSLSDEVGGLAARVAYEGEGLAKTRGELNAFATALKGGTVASTGLIERQVAAATATTALEKAQARLNDVRARGASIDRLSAGSRKDAALAEYRRDLTSATVAVNNATAAQKAARTATSAHNKELREQAAAARRAATEADRQADFIAKLVDQANALEQRGVSSQVTAQLDAFQRQFNRAPSDGQRQQIEDAVRRNQLLGDERAVLDQLLGPLEAYQRGIAALNDLLARGRITQDEYNRSLRELPLQQALAGVDKSLTGTLFEYQAQLDAIEDSISRAVKVVDDAEKAGIIDKTEAEARRTALRGPDSGGDVVVSSRDDSARGRARSALERGRRQDLRQLDLGLTSRPDLQADAQRRGVDDEEQQRLQVIADARNQELINEQQYQDRKTAIVQEADEKRRAIEEATTQTRLAAAQSAADALLGVAEAYAGRQSGIYKGIFLVSKAFAIAQAVLALQQNIAEASKYGFPQNIPFIAAAIAQGASILTNVQSVSAQFRSGGYTGDGEDGEEAGTVHRNEFVVNSRGTRENRALLEAINSGRPARVAAQNRAFNDNPASGGLNLRVVQHPGVEVEERRDLTTGDVELIARRVATRVSRQTTQADLRNANSKTSKTLGAATSAKRARR